MNKAITDGLMLMPPAFAGGLNVWSRENGTPGSVTYQGAADAAQVPADQDFAGCLELQKTETLQKLRYMGETPFLPGCYLRVTARVKAMSGNLPSVRIAAWAGAAGGTNVAGVTQTGPSVALSAYGKVETISAIIGSGLRGGVDMVWGTQPIYGHFGLDLTGANGGVVRIDDIVIEDLTSAFLRDMMDWVDVRDYGATGNGVTNDAAAIDAADAVATATGRTLLISKGTYFIGSHLTIEANVRFEGKLTMPIDQRLSLTRNFDFPTYAAAFDSEILGFKKAYQALVHYTDHDSLDLQGRRIEVDAPIDMWAAATRDTYSNRRVIRNGALTVIDGPAWTPDVVTSQATYSTANEKTLTAVVNVANIAIGSLVTGTGVGREIYVKARNVGAQTITLSQPLYNAAGTQTFTFTRFKYLLDFSGFTQLDRLNLSDLDIQCNGFSSGILLAPQGNMVHIRDCYINKPKNRGITSMGSGCQDILIDRCQFVSNEMALLAQDRQSVAFNVNANDAKIRDNRFMRFGITGVMNGNNHLITGNHWFQGDSASAGLVQPGIVLCETNCHTSITGNYIDNATIEWTNEYEADPSMGVQFSFGGLTISNNIFLAGGVAAWTAFIVVKPYGAGHFIQGLHVSGNVFKCVNGSIDRVERVDSSFATLDNSRMRNVVFEANTFTAVNQMTVNPVTFDHAQDTAQTTWTLTPGAFLPFGGWARTVESVVAVGIINGAGSERRSDMPYVTVEQGTTKQEIRLNWLATSRGKVKAIVRMDNPN